MSRFSPIPMIGSSQAFLEILRVVARMAECLAPVLIEGETGTGKELAARAIHYRGIRAGGPFVPVNCGSLPDSLVESELFGHCKGAFTDAKQAREGLVSLAMGGTLFLDEVDTLSPKAQVVLLRFLQDQHFRPVGGTQEKQGDVRLLAASNADLEALVESGTFRRDLYYRLKIMHLKLPPLRDRREDIPALATHILEGVSHRFQMPPKQIAPEGIAWLQSQPWPGNIRELENLLTREFFLAEGPLLYLSPGPTAPTTSSPLPGFGDLNFNAAKAKAIDRFERDFLEHLMHRTHWNVTRAAALAGKERRALGKLLKKHGLSRPEAPRRPGSATDWT